MMKKEKVFKLSTFTPMAQGESDHIVIGGYYELSNGKIGEIYRSDNLRRVVEYHCDYGEECQKTTFKEVKSWKRRNDLKDFPNSSNHKLPYEFDLHWDIKHESKLEKIMQYPKDFNDIYKIYGAVCKYPNLLKKFKQYME